MGKLYDKICRACGKKFRTCFPDNPYHSLECGDAWRLARRIERKQQRLTRVNHD